MIAKFRPTGNQMIEHNLRQTCLATNPQTIVLIKPTPPENK